MSGFRLVHPRRARTGGAHRLAPIANRVLLIRRTAILDPLVEQDKEGGVCGTARGGGTLGVSYIGSLTLALVLLFSGCATATAAKAPPTFPVALEVDFGPAGKPAVRQVVQVERGATPRDATEKFFPVEKGAVCCDPREVSTIDGVASDPATNRWWTVSINGSKKGVSPYRSRLKPGDVVRWEYKQYGQ